MQYNENIRLAIQGLTDHKFRSFLTMLGIIFGVASVITMLSIGEGAKREAIAKYQAANGLPATGTINQALLKTMGIS